MSLSVKTMAKLHIIYEIDKFSLSKKKALLLFTSGSAFKSMFNYVLFSIKEKPHGLSMSSILLNNLF